jgi:hypothetical protein
MAIATQEVLFNIFIQLMAYLQSYKLLQIVAGQIDTISHMVVINGVSIKEDLLAKQIKLFPNPVNSSLMIQAENDKIQNVYVYNLLGQELLNATGMSQIEVHLDVSLLPNGILHYRY